MTTLSKTAQKLKVNPTWLWNLIKFESRANPAARNAITGARGLIQFLHSTARSLGFKDADDLVKKNPTFDKQLSGPVLKYLAKYAPFPTKQSLYMAVFYPAARTWSPAAVFPANVRKANPGVDTVQDYINLVEGKRKKAIGFLPKIIIAAIGAFVFYKIAERR